MQKDMIQFPNPRTKRWVKVNTASGCIISQKKSSGAYADVRVADKVKCDCGHFKKNHYRGEGQCRECGCTWFHPEVKYCEKRKRISFIVRAKAREGEPSPKPKRVSFIARR